MTNVIVEIMVEVLNILALTTKEVKRKRLSELMSHKFSILYSHFYLERYFRKLAGNTDLEDSLQRLDRLTQEEARMASTEQLKMAQNIDDRVAAVQGEVRGTRGDVQIVRGAVQIVGHRVRAINNRVQGINTEVKDIFSKVQGVDDKFDRDIRSLSFTVTLIPMALTSSQGTTSEIVFFDGFRPQTNLPIISLHAKLVTAALLSGSFKGVYSRSGNLLAPSCGYTESVRHSWPSLCDDP